MEESRRSIFSYLSIVSLFSPALWSLSLAQLCSKFGTWISFLAILLILPEQKGSALWVALAIIIKRLPSTLLSYSSGALSDRFSSIKVVFGSQLLMLLTTGVFYSQAIHDEKLGWTAWICLAMVSLAEGIYRPAFQAAAAELSVDRNELARFNLFNHTLSMGLIIAASFFYVMIGDFLKLSDFIALDALTYIFALVSIYPFLSSKKKAHFINTVKSQKASVALPKSFALGALILGALYAALSLFMATLPALENWTRKQSVGLSFAVFGMGIVAAYIVLISRNRILIRSGLVLGIISLPVLSFYKNLWEFLPSLFFLATGFGIFKLLIEKRLILNGEKGHTGRLFAQFFIVEELAITLTLLSIVLGSMGLGF